MTPTAELKRVCSAPVNKAEVLRYAGCKEADDTVSQVLDGCIEVYENKLADTVCYCVLDVEVKADLCDFGVFSVRSADLGENLKDCRQAVVFAATLGVEPDRLIIRYGRLIPSRAVILSALADERIEALCDAFCRDMGLTRFRFSPGYGDLPLDFQRQIFSLLDCPRKLGLSLNESLLMSPSKSVTAIVGLD
ncbi:MAG: Vitamin B12 dependent methionine synthase activation subunit [Clostridia bacterium]|nr:Vitamin B12 dependent methionine synthase activation subunit [Clostridia bacterium]